MQAQPAQIAYEIELKAFDAGENLGHRAPLDVRLFDADDPLVDLVDLFDHTIDGVTELVRDDAAPGRGDGSIVEQGPTAWLCVQGCGF